jgi:hypothetical protein
MTWTIQWSFVAERRDLLALPMHTAERLDAAVLRFAETNRGPVSRVSPHDPRRLQLVVPGAIAYLFADHDSGILLVSRVFQRA